MHMSVVVSFTAGIFILIVTYILQMWGPNLIITSLICNTKYMAHSFEVTRMHFLFAIAQIFILYCILGDFDTVSKICSHFIITSNWMYTENCKFIY